MHPTYVAPCVQSSTLLFAKAMSHSFGNPLMSYPIPKISKPQSIETDLRPISLIPVLSKILEDYIFQSGPDLDMWRPLGIAFSSGGPPYLRILKRRQDIFTVIHKVYFSSTKNLNKNVHLRL